jgi:hypothetical protein
LIWLLTAAGIVLLEGVILYDATREERHAKSRTDRDHQQAPSIVCAPEHNRADEKKHHAAERDHWTREHRNNRIIAIFSAVAAGAAIAAAAIALFAYSEARRQADAAWAQVSVGEKSTKYQMRAYVTSNAIELITYGEQVGDEGQRWVISPIVENSGQTPTRNLRTSSNHAYGQGFMTSDEFEKFSPYKMSFGPALIMPRSDITIGRFSGSAKLMGQFRRREVQAHIWGAAKYEDIFGDHHLSEWCYTPEIPPADFEKYPVGQRLRTQSTLCDKHNCTDEECGPDWEERAKQ